MDFSLMKPVFEKYKDEPGSLIAILQQAQELYGWLPTELQSHISEQTGIPPAKVMGAATFYAQFRLKPVGKNLILLCQGTACHVNGSAEIELAIADYLGVAEGEITEDGLFTYNNVACLGCCSLSPAMMITSASGATSANGGNNRVYGKLTGKSAVEVLKGLAEEK